MKIIYTFAGLGLLALSPAIAVAQIPAPPTTAELAGRATSHQASISRVEAILGERAGSGPSPSASTTGSSAHICNSRIGGTLPQVGPLHHSSVAICPPGHSPTVVQNGTSVNNPNCTYYGTRPGTSTFQVEQRRVGVTCQPAQASASAVQQCVNTFNKPYSAFTNNCQHAANSCQAAANNRPGTSGQATSGRTNTCAAALAALGGSNNTGRSPAASGNGGKGSPSGGGSKGGSSGGKSGSSGGAGGKGGSGKR